MLIKSVKIPVATISMKWLKLSVMTISVLCVSTANSVMAITIIDDRKQPVSLSHSPQRIATISTFAADTVVALGQIPVASSTFGDEITPAFLHPKMQQIPSLGMRAKTNLETLASVRPDLIVAIRRYTEPHARKFEEIAPYLAFDAITYQDSLNIVTSLSQALGVPEQGLRLNNEFESLIRQYQTLLSTQAKTSPITAALLVSSSETPFAYYDHFLPVTLLKKLNVNNVIGASPEGDKGELGYRINLERLLVLNPDVLFVFKSNRQRAYINNPIWRYLKAVKNHQVYEVGQHWKDGAGPISRRYILEEMANWLYPEQFSTPEIPDPLRGSRLANDR